MSDSPEKALTLTPEPQFRVTTGTQDGIRIVTGTHSEKDGMVTISRDEYEALQATTKAELCAALQVAIGEIERLREKLKANQDAAMSPGLSPSPEHTEQTNV